MSDYFTKDTDKALALFILAHEEEKKTREDEQNTEESEKPKLLERRLAFQKRKHQLFDEDIRPAFEKLIENLIYVYSFFNLDDVETLQKECLTNLYEMIPKFDPNKGTKGFSYFNVIAKNWFIQKTRERKKRNKLESELYLDLDHEVARRDPNLSVSHHEDFLEDKERWVKFYEAMDSWRDRLLKKPERQVLEAVIFLMRNPDLVTIHNKKAVYLYLRELTNLNTKQVVINLKKIKQLYEEWSEEFEETGES